MEQNWGWIEIPIFATIALGFGIWQLVSVNREIARDRAAKAARETADPAAAPDDPAAASESGAHFGPGHAKGQQQLDSR